MFRTLLLLPFAMVSVLAMEPPQYDYRLLATTRTSKMEKEMNQAAEVGFVFASVMGGETAFGGKEVVVVMMRNQSDASPAGRSYKLLATSKTSTLQKELQQAGAEGYAYLGQTVFESAFGGKEASVILERVTDKPATRYAYRLLATSRTSTMQKELQEAGAAGFRVLGMSVGNTAFGGAEVLCVLVKEEE